MSDEECEVARERARRRRLADLERLRTRAVTRHSSFLRVHPFLGLPDERTEPGGEVCDPGASGAA